jgi:integrase
MPGDVAQGRLDTHGVWSAACIGHLKPATVGCLIGEMMPKGYTMHTLRHRFASAAYRGSRNVRAAQVLHGHQSIDTTERYRAVDDSEIRAAMEAAGMGA